MTVWDSVCAVAATAGAAAKLASTKAKLRTEIALVDREIEARKRKFGVEMYDHCAPLTENQSFYADEDKLTQVLRPPLLQAQKEIAAQEGKKNDFKQVLSDKQSKRAGAFPVPATTLGGQVVNAGKTAAMMGSEAKTKTDMAVKERHILTAKQEFGLELYDVFVGLEDQGWLPPDRNVRAIYDQCRRDIDDILKKKDKKKERLRELGGGEGGGLSSSATGRTSTMTKTSAITYREEGNHQQPGTSTRDSGSSQRQGGALSMASQYGSTLSKAVASSNYGSTQTKAAAGLAVAAAASQYGSTKKTTTTPKAPHAGNTPPTAPNTFEANFSSSTTAQHQPAFKTSFPSTTAPTSAPPPPPEFQASFPSTEPPSPPPAFRANFSSNAPAASQSNNAHKPNGVPTFQNNDLLSFDYND